jgi:hypothetical protein
LGLRQSAPKNEQGNKETRNGQRTEMRKTHNKIK